VTVVGPLEERRGQLLAALDVVLFRTETRISNSERGRRSPGRSAREEDDVVDVDPRLIPFRSMIPTTRKRVPPPSPSAEAFAFPNSSRFTVRPMTHTRRRASTSASPMKEPISTCRFRTSEKAG